MAKYKALTQIVSHFGDGKTYEVGSIVPTAHLTADEIQLLITRGGIEPFEGDASVSELEGLKGLLAAHAQAFADAGITTLAQLSAASAEVLTRLDGVNTKQFTRWQTEARAKLAAG